MKSESLIGILKLKKELLKFKWHLRWLLCHVLSYIWMVMACRQNGNSQKAFLSEFFLLWENIYIHKRVPAASQHLIGHSLHFVAVFAQWRFCIMRVQL